MNLFYNLFIRAYYFTILLATPFNRKAYLWVSGRRKLLKNIKHAVKQTDNPIWFHCASLGEFEQGRPVIEQIKKQNPQQKTLLTFYSPSGFEIRKNYSQADYIFYLPLDTKANAEELIRIINPRMVYFVKYEFWKNLLFELKQKNIPTFLISAHFRTNQIFFKWYGKWFRNILNCFTKIFVQNNTSQQLLNDIGVSHVIIAGDTRFDRVTEIVKQATTLPLLQQFSEKNKILLGGSTWPADEKLLIKYIQETHINNTKLILAPHEVHREHIQNIINNLKTEYILYTQENTEEEIKNAKVLIIDTIGVLSSAYKYANISYIGGGFGVGIHNTLEAATFGIPVIFGPNYTKFNEAVKLKELEAAFSINNYEELENILNKLLREETFCKETGAKASSFVQEQIGATRLILQSTLNFS